MNASITCRTINFTICSKKIINIFNSHWWFLLFQFGKIGFSSEEIIHLPDLLKHRSKNKTQAQALQLNLRFITPT